MSQWPRVARQGNARPGSRRRLTAWRRCRRCTACRQCKNFVLFYSAPRVGGSSDASLTSGSPARSRIRNERALSRPNIVSCNKAHPLRACRKCRTPPTKERSRPRPTTTPVGHAARSDAWVAQCVTRGRRSPPCVVSTQSSRGGLRSEGQRHRDGARQPEGRGQQRCRTPPGHRCRTMRRCHQRAGRVRRVHPCGRAPERSRLTGGVGRTAGVDSWHG